METLIEVAAIDNDQMLLEGLATWISKVPDIRLSATASSVTDFLSQSVTARIVLLDNIYVEGISTPVAGIDQGGNTYQMRRLNDGSRVRVLKNFVSEGELRERLSPYASAFTYEPLQYYWLAEYTVK